LGDGGPGLADPFDDLDVAGPITALQWRDLEVNGFRGGSALRAERWDYDGRSFIEFSVRVKDADKAPDRRARLVVLLEQRRLIPDQDAKSEAALRDLLSEPRRLRMSAMNRALCDRVSGICNGTGFPVSRPTAWFQR
jgi:hypothetical protein